MIGNKNWIKKNEKTLKEKKQCHGKEIKSEREGKKVKKKT